MALPELLANSPTPGTREALSTLAAELSEAGTEFEMVANVPTSLQKVGQFRVVIGSEIILCEGKAEATKKVKVLERGAESTTKVIHAPGASVFHLLTAQGARSALAMGEETVAMAYRNTEQKIKINKFERVLVDTVVKDPFSRFKTGAGEGFYVTPCEGYYQCSGSAEILCPKSNLVYASFSVSGTEKLRGVRYANPSTTVEVEVGVMAAGVIFAKANEKIEFGLFVQAEKTIALNENHAVSVVRVA